jgi:hypothetical protein
MNFVPFVPYVPPPQPPSPQAQELGRRLAETIEGFRLEHPDTSAAEIRQAIGLALAGRGGPSPAAVRVLFGLVVALVALGFLLFRRLPGGEAWPPVAAIIAFVLILGVGFAVFFKNR